MKISIKDIVKAAQANGTSDKDLLAFVMKTAAGEAQLGDEDIAQMLQGAQGGEGAGAGAPPPGPSTAEPPAAPGGPTGGMPPLPPTADPAAGAGAPGAEGGAPPLQLSEEQIQEVVQIILQALEGEAGAGGEAGSPAGAGAPPAPAAMAPKTSEEKEALKNYITDFIKEGNDRLFPLEVTVRFLKVALDTCRAQAEQAQVAATQQEQEKYAEAHFSGMLEQAAAYGLTPDQAVALIQKHADLSGLKEVGTMDPSSGPIDLNALDQARTAASAQQAATPTSLLDSVKHMFNAGKPDASPALASMHATGAMDAGSLMGGASPVSEAGTLGRLDLARLQQSATSAAQPQPTLRDMIMQQLHKMKEMAGQGVHAFGQLPQGAKLGLGLAGSAALGAGAGYGLHKLMGNGQEQPSVETPAEGKPKAQKQPKEDPKA